MEKNKILTFVAMAVCLATLLTLGVGAQTISQGDQAGRVYQTVLSPSINVMYGQNINLLRRTWNFSITDTFGFNLPEHTWQESEQIVTNEGSNFVNIYSTYDYETHTITKRLDFSESALMYPEGNENAQARIEIVGGDTIVSIDNIDYLDAFIECANDCKVIYDVEWAFWEKYEYEDTNGPSQAGQWVYQTYTNTIDHTNGENIKYFDGDLKGAMLSQLWLDKEYIMVKNFSMRVYARRWTSSSNMTIHTKFEDVEEFSASYMIEKIIGDGILITDGANLPNIKSLRDFLNDTVQGVFDINLFPAVTVGTIVFMPIAFALVMWFLKVFAGG